MFNSREPIVILSLSRFDTFCPSRALDGDFLSMIGSGGLDIADIDHEIRRGVASGLPSPRMLVFCRSSEARETDGLIGNGSILS